MEDRNTIVGKPGPFEIVEALAPEETNLPGTAPRRRYDCSNYDTCLELAAALNWDSFTCRGCNEEISQPLLWRAHQAKRKDLVAGSLCEHLPEIGVLSPTVGQNASAISNDATTLPSVIEPSAIEPSPIDLKA